MFTVQILRTPVIIVPRSITLLLPDIYSLGMTELKIAAVGSRDQFIPDLIPI